MSKTVWFISYKLKKGASVPEFLLASEACNNEVLSKKKGFISWQVLNDGDTWVDLTAWETLEDAKNAEKGDGTPNAIAKKFYSFIDFKSLKTQIYSVVKSY
jgi:heme-degrading monooxygenase HmoA